MEANEGLMLRKQCPILRAIARPLVAKALAVAQGLACNLKDSSPAKRGQNDMRKEAEEEGREAKSHPFRTQFCPRCGGLMGDMPGMRDAVCRNCGYKDPCCE